jgi:hypothetical protein
MRTEEPLLPQDLARERARVPGVVQEIVSGASVPEAGVQEAVRAEGDHPGVVAREGLVDGQEDFLAFRVGRIMKGRALFLRRDA